MGLQITNYSRAYPPRSFLALVILVVCSGLPTAAVAQNYGLPPVGTASQFFVGQQVASWFSTSQDQSSEEAPATEEKKSENNLTNSEASPKETEHSGPQDEDKQNSNEKDKKDESEGEQAEPIHETLGGNQVYSLKDGTQFVESNQGNNLIRVKPPGADWDKSYLIEKDLFGVTKNEAGGFSFKKPDYGDGLKPIGAVQFKGTDTFRPIYQKRDGTTGFFNGSNEWVENTGTYDPFGTNEYAAKPIPEGYENNQGRLNPSSRSGGSTAQGGSGGGSSGGIGGGGGGGGNPSPGQPNGGGGGSSVPGQAGPEGPEPALPPVYTDAGEKVPDAIVRAARTGGVGTDPKDPAKFAKNKDGTWRACDGKNCLPRL